MNKYNIAYDNKYRANPKNRYHYSYQASVNRWFGVALVLLAIIESIFSFGFKTTAVFVAVSPFVVIVILMLLMAVNMFFDIAFDFLEWLGGY